MTRHIEERGPSGQRFGITVTSYIVGSWCPTPDGSGPAEAVAVQIMTDISNVSFFLRLKSPEAVDVFVQALLKHKKDVWPND